MKILAFEFLSSGGVAGQHPLNEPLAEFQSQGSQMLQAVCEDFLDLGHDVLLPLAPNVPIDAAPDCRTTPIYDESELQKVILQLAEEADAILAICPESDRCLERYLTLLAPWSQKVISPDIDFVRLCGNKWACYLRLNEYGVPTPRTTKVTEKLALDNFCKKVTFPLVAKPIDGAGSDEVRLIGNRTELLKVNGDQIVQTFAAGLATSIAVVTKPNGAVHFCEPGEQIFRSAPFGPHSETKFPLPPGLRQRTLKLADKAVRALPQTRGYFGIDMVLGETAAQDFVIEINPRLTTSYCYLRKWSGENIAALML